jgi:hypothetical protein
LEAPVDDDAGMKQDVRAPVIRLLTVSQAAVELGLTTGDVDRLVETGDLHAVNVSPHGGRRFWPADIEACVTGQTAQTRPTAGIDNPASTIAPEAAQPATDIRSIASADAVRPPHRVRAKLDLAPSHPRWPRYEAATERAASSYLAFRDAEHVTQYLRARQTLDVDPTNSVHSDAKPNAELLPA